MRFLSSVLVLCAFGIAGANAAPSVRMLGTNTARVGTNAAVVKSDSKATSTSTPQRLGSIRAKNIGTAAPVTINKVPGSTLSTASSDESRLGLGKYVNVGTVNSGNVKKAPAYQPAQPATPSADISALTDRISDLERAVDAKQDAISVSDGLVLDENIILLDSDVVQAQIEDNLDYYYDKDEVDAKIAGIDIGDIDGKQDVIEDLETIRSGASAGSTALQPGALDGYATKNELNTTVTNYYTKTEVDDKVANIVAGDMGEALSGKQDAIADLETIRSGAAAGSTALQPGALNNYLTAQTAQTTYQPIGNYATKEELQNVAAPDMSGYLTKVNAQQTYQPIGNYLTEHQDISGLISNPTLPSWSGDYVLKVNVSDSGNYTYSWAKASDYSGGGSSGGGSNDDCDPNWEVCD